MAWAYFVAYSVWAVAMLAGFAPRGVTNDLLFLPLYLSASWISFLAGSARSDEPRLARGWRLVGAAWLCSAFGGASWVLYQLWPSAAFDWSGWLVYNFYYPLTMLGLWHFFEMPERGDSRLRLAVECSIVAVATLVLAWYFVFRFDEPPAPTLWPFRKTIGILVFSELLLMVGATAVLHRPARSAERRSLSVFGIATFAAGIADFVYQQNFLIGANWSGPTADLLLAFAGTLVIVAAWMSRVRQPSTDATVPGVAVGLTLLPYLAVGLVSALLAFESAKANLGEGPIAGLIVGGGVLLALVIARLLVAQREYAREATARSTQDARFRLLVQRSTDAILVVGVDGRIGYASPAFCRIVGSVATELEGRPLTEFVPANQRDRLATWVGASDRSLGEWQIGRDGVWRDMEAVATDLTNDPVVSGVVVNLRDVTERVRLEAELVQSQKLEIVGRLSSSIAHDFNNLLTIIIGNLQLARLSGSKGGSPDLLAVEKAARRGAALSRQLLSLSRPTELSLKVVDLSALIRALEPTLRTVLPSSIKMVVTTGAAATPVTLDDVQAEQILLNLALNARDAMPSGGTLDVSVGVEAGRGRVLLAVSDTGIGMSDDTLAHAFEPFFTTKLGFGTGLGLSTVRRIAINAGGEVHIASRPGTGTTVTLALPLVADQQEHEPPKTPAPPGGIGHILVVDDEPAVRRVLVRQLSQGGYRVSEAPDGVLALERLRNATIPIDLVLTDLVMPNMGGEALARRIGQEFSGLPVLCMSGTPGLTTGGNEPWSADQVIAKPADIEVVAHRIAEALTQAKRRSRSTAWR